MSVVILLLLALGSTAISGVPGLLLPRRGNAGQYTAVALTISGSSLALAAMILSHFSNENLTFVHTWAIPWGQFSIALDNLSLIFLIPIFLISALGAVYGLGYWPQSRNPATAPRLQLCWGLMATAMATVVLARDGVLLLMAWEVMAISAFFLVATDEEQADARSAAWAFLVASHFGTLCLFGFFVLLKKAAGSFDLWQTLPDGVSPHLATALFVLGTVGFGLKAGLMPLHVWLPGAHSNAPSHVSAIFSGVLLKVGIYGLLRVAGLQAVPPVWCGITLLAVGVCSGLFGISFAAGQRDLKRLLAYSSIENIGIIAMGIGLAVLGRSLDRPAWIVLGLGGALLHVLNHGLFKPLLFMGAGSVIHATETRQMDRLGGLGKSMPATLILFTIGAVAICGLPPLNGFFSELLIYLGLFGTATDQATGPQWSWIVLAAPALAMIGAMAVVTFVKLVGFVFLGNLRNDYPHAHDPTTSMRMPMMILAAICIIIGVAPALLMETLRRGVMVWSPSVGTFANMLTENVPPLRYSGIALALLALTTAIVWIAFKRRAAGTVRPGITWDCGYVRPTARMEYTGTSFAQMPVELLAWILLPIKRLPSIPKLFSPASRFQYDVPDTLMDRGLMPALGRIERSMWRTRFIQGGSIQLYLLYIMGVLLLLLFLR